MPTSDPQLNLNDRLGYHYAVMSICLWPILLLVIRDIHEDRMYAEKDFYLGMYGRLVYILTQVRNCLFAKLSIKTNKTNKFYNFSHFLVFFLVYVFG